MSLLNLTNGNLAALEKDHINLFHFNRLSIVDLIYMPCTCYVHAMYIFSQSLNQGERI